MKHKVENARRLSMPSAIGGRQETYIHTFPTATRQEGGFLGSRDKGKHLRGMI
jgi:hypothetical protein